MLCRVTWSRHVCGSSHPFSGVSATQSSESKYFVWTVVKRLLDSKPLWFFKIIQVSYRGIDLLGRWNTSHNFCSNEKKKASIWSLFASILVFYNWVTWGIVSNSLWLHRVICALTQTSPGNLGDLCCRLVEQLPSRGLSKSLCKEAEVRNKHANTTQDRPYQRTSNLPLILEPLELLGVVFHQADTRLHCWIPCSDGNLQRLHKPAFRQLEDSSSAEQKHWLATSLIRSLITVNGGSMLINGS